MMTDAGVAMTNIVYQGKSPNVLYVVSTQGSLDPWKALGPSEDLSQFAPVIIIDGTVGRFLSELFCIGWIFRRFSLPGFTS